MTVPGATVRPAVVTGASHGFGRAIAAALVREQTWESFGRPWEVDTRHVFGWTKAALTTPLPPGSLVVALSSGAALAGSPLSGGYAGAKAAIRLVARYAAEESTRAGLGLRVTTLLPRFTPATDLGGAAAAAYAARAGAAQDTFAARLAPALTPEQVAKAVVGLASDPTPPASEYQLDAGGLHPLD